MPGSSVLIVDDDETFRLISRETLQKKGYEVADAADGAQALEAVRRKAPDLVMVDLMMPGVDGVSLCRELREIPGLEKTRILVVTALNDPKILEDARRFGAVDHLIKPVESAVLLDKVEALLSPASRGSL